MAFIQIIDFRSDDIDGIREHQAEWEKATEGRRTLRRSILAKDHNDENRYLVLAFFDSHESAMENSNLPETGEFAAKQTALGAGEPTFIDLDVIEDRS